MLITTITELQEVVPVSVDLDYRSIQPSLKTAERRFLLPLLGRDFYGEISQDYDEADLTDIESELIDYIRAVIGPLALWHYVQHGGVSIDNSGIYKPKNDQRWNLGEAEQQRLEDFYLRQGLDAQEDLLAYLDDNADDFPTYANSPERRLERRGLVYAAQTVQDIFPLLWPRSIFRALREAIRYVEVNRLAPLMQGYYGILTAKLETELTPQDEELRTLARAAVIYLATARALLTRTVKLTHEGLEVMMGARTQVGEPENARIEAAAREYQASGETQLVKLHEALKLTPPTGYVLPVAAIPIGRFKSADDSKIFYI